MNVIMPCAGSGLRLGLPYPKELHFISEKTALIDLSFEKLLPYKDIVDSVTIILSPAKGTLIEYLSRWSKDFHIRFCYFNDNYFEWAGSILSSEPDFGDKNVVLLPDSFILEDANLSLVGTFDAMLDEHDVVFAYRPELDKRKYMNLGALNVTDGKVTAFCDKPKNQLERFNGYWCSFGFGREFGRPLLELMTRSIQRHDVDINELGASIGCFPVRDYIDLGVWPNVFDIQSKTSGKSHLEVLQHQGVGR